MVHKKRRSEGTSTSGGDNQMDEDDSQMQPVTHRMVDLRRLRNIPQSQWPEETLDYFGLRLNNAQKSRLAALVQRKIAASRYACVDTLTQLGILNEVKGLAELIGLWKFISTPYVTYRTLTLEFLSTYTHDFKTLSFQLDGTTFTVTDRQLNEICEFPNPPQGDTYDWGDPWSEYNTADEIEFESEINHPQGRDSSRSTVINHPVLRYLQRCMGYSIFGRGETASNYNRRDVYLLFKMLYSHSLMCVKPDLGAMMLRHIDHVTGIRQVGGGISVGGFVTRLALHFGVIPRTGTVYRIAAEPEPPLLNMRYLIQQAKIIRKEGNVYYHVPYRGNLIPLPLPPINPNDKSTWQARETPQAQPPLHQPPPLQTMPPVSQSMPYPAGVQADDSVMQYLIGMNSRMEQGFASLNTEWQGRFERLETSNTELARQVTDMRNEHRDRFDDLYVMHDDTQNQMYDVYNLSYHMATFRIDNDEMPSFELPSRTRRTDYRYRFEFPPPPPPHVPPRAGRRGHDN